jgi:hypothetical protein
MITPNLSVRILELPVFFVPALGGENKMMSLARLVMPAFITTLPFCTAAGGGSSCDQKFW